MRSSRCEQATPPTYERFSLSLSLENTNGRAEFPALKISHAARSQTTTRQPGFQAAWIQGTHGHRLSGSKPPSRPPMPPPPHRIHRSVAGILADSDPKSTDVTFSVFKSKCPAAPTIQLAMRTLIGRRSQWISTSTFSELFALYFRGIKSTLVLLSLWKAKLFRWKCSSPSVWPSKSATMNVECIDIRTGLVWVKFFLRRGHSFCKL